MTSVLGPQYEPGHIFSLSLCLGHAHMHIPNYSPITVNFTSYVITLQVKCYSLLFLWPERIKFKESVANGGCKRFCYQRFSCKHTDCVNGCEIFMKSGHLFDLWFPWP